MLKVNCKNPRVLLLIRKALDSRYVFYQTVLRGILRIPDDAKLPKLFSSFKLIRGLNAILSEDTYSYLSYMKDWQFAFEECPRIDVTVCDTLNLVDFWREVRDPSYDLIVVMHSALGDDVDLVLNRAHWFHKRKGKLISFVGNEYDFMDKKYAFLRESGADAVCSQLPLDSAQWLYSEVNGLEVLPAPHGLNPNAYRPADESIRKNDLGFRGAEYPAFIGDAARNNFIKIMAKAGESQGLKCDIAFEKLDRGDWARFLSGCKGIVGAESGLLRLDRKGALVELAKEYCQKNPQATSSEVWEHCYKQSSIPAINGRCLSSRHFEPIGTKTCQILMEGRYNDILIPNEHYIEVKRDFSNLDDAIRLFSDLTERQRIQDSAYEYAMEQHTYAKRVEYIVSSVLG